MREECAIHRERTNDSFYPFRYLRQQICFDRHEKRLYVYTFRRTPWKKGAVNEWVRQQRAVKRLEKAGSTDESPYRMGVEE